MECKMGSIQETVRVRCVFGCVCVFFGKKSNQVKQIKLSTNHICFKQNNNLICFKKTKHANLLVVVFKLKTQTLIDLKYFD